MEKTWGSKQLATNKDSNNDIVTSYNKIFFYGSVNKKNIIQLNKSLTEIEAKSLVESTRLETPPAAAKIFINSVGGSITAGISGLEHIRLSKIPTHTVVDGLCASAATFLSVVATERYMTEYSFMLIHQLSTNFWGKYSEFEDAKQNLDLMMSTIKKIYQRYTKVPKRKINSMLKRDLLWDSKQCLAYGLIDEII